ncbi:UDP-N-acetylmuramate dehydrogenase [Alienimonas californiensis]|uniref:UDP-N-acetylenolpyruvoylglucosamine reductase n=1 Tax=Alienimonas californiensis TaxID=2527989 RepID=A0A517PAH6_9PLAN|nr:UDP-N-acetylmuramate dehydrogenase [Alienimonas californiensis]QDT16374.1 UDP-N-acetylenolpyruvoylglucosamine reductase MurB [Alienimonas californiensis]
MNPPDVPAPDQPDAEDGAVQSSAEPPAEPFADVDLAGAVVVTDEPLAPKTWLRVGGPAQHFAEPTSREQLQALVARCAETGTNCRLLGGGSNLLVRDEGVSGLVIRLPKEHWSDLTIDAESGTVTVDCGAPLSHLVAETVKAGLAGLETLVGIPGTVGGALHGNSGGRHADVGSVCESVEVMTRSGEIFTRTRDELSFGYRRSSLDELCLLRATFTLRPADPDALADRARKTWILKKSSQPLSHQSAGCVFMNPRGQSAGDLIERAGLKGTRVGGAEVSDRHGNFIVTGEGARSADVLRLIDLCRDTVLQRTGVELETELRIW